MWFITTTPSNSNKDSAYQQSLDRMHKLIVQNNQQNKSDTEELKAKNEANIAWINSDSAVRDPWFSTDILDQQDKNIKEGYWEAWKITWEGYDKANKIIDEMQWSKHVYVPTEPAAQNSWPDSDMANALAVAWTYTPTPEDNTKEVWDKLTWEEADKLWLQKTWEEKWSIPEIKWYSKEEFDNASGLWKVWMAWANLLASTERIGAGIANSVIHPEDTWNWIKMLWAGIKDTVEWNDSKEAEIIKNLWSEWKYWSWENFKKWLVEDPAWFISDAMSLLSWGASLTSKVWKLSEASKTGEAASLASKAWELWDAANIAHEAWDIWKANSLVDEAISAADASKKASDFSSTAWKIASWAEKVSDIASKLNPANLVWQWISKVAWLPFKAVSGVLKKWLSLNSWLPMELIDDIRKWAWDSLADAIRSTTDPAIDINKNVSDAISNLKTSKMAEVDNLRAKAFVNIDNLDLTDLTKDVDSFIQSKPPAVTWFKMNPTIEKLDSLVKNPITEDSVWDIEWIAQDLLNSKKPWEADLWKNIIDKLKKQSPVYSKSEEIYGWLPSAIDSFKEAFWMDMKNWTTQNMADSTNKILSAVKDNKSVWKAMLKSLTEIQWNEDLIWKLAVNAAKITEWQSSKALWSMWKIMWTIWLWFSPTTSVLALMHLASSSPVFAAKVANSLWVPIKALEKTIDNINKIAIWKVWKPLFTVWDAVSWVASVWKAWLTTLNQPITEARQESNIQQAQQSAQPAM